MKSGMYTEQQYTFRKNTLVKYDHWRDWLTLNSDDGDSFYDTKLQQSYTFEDSEKGEDTDSKLIAEIYLRIDNEQMIHRREGLEMGIMNWLGAIGGVHQVLLFILGFFFTGYSSFH